MRAEIIAIGTELTSGQNLDTNSPWLSQRLARMGISVHFHSTVGDDLTDQLAVLRQALERADLVILTGGLGPTQDDLTREALAKLAGVELVLHEPSLAAIRERFASRQRPMPERNQTQALFPRGSEPVPNALGTAPGIWMEIPRPSAADQRVLFIAVPGVPSEMKAMILELEPRLQARHGRGGQIIVERKLHCFGAGESAIEEKALDFTRRGHVPEVGITVSDAIVSFRIRASAASQAEAEAAIAPVEAALRQRLGDWLFGVDDEELHDVVGKLLLERQRTVAVAESLTGGLVCHLISRVPGVSASLMGGVVAYANEAKVALLGVPSEWILRHGAVSSQVAEAMAKGCRERFGTHLAVSTTGIAGPSGATAAKPVGMVYIGLSHPAGEQSWLVNWFGTRQEIQHRAAKSALNALRLHLLSDQP